MTATEELRRLLTAAGVEWRERVWGGKHSVTTFWHARGVRWHYRENMFGELRLHADGLTPEQAIAATLGRGTCKVTDECKCSVCGWQYPCSNYTTYTTCDGRTAYLPSWRFYNDCGRVNFCPNCGRRVVEPTTNDVDAEVDDG